MAQVDTDLTFEWDLDNDGDYNETEEDITSFVMSGESVSGRNWPSMLQGKTTPGQLHLTLNNSDDRFSFFNSSSPLNTGDFSLQTGRKIRIRTSTSSIQDPQVIDFDRFNGTGAIGSTEGESNTWNVSIGSSGGFTRVTDSQIGGRIEATGDFQLATADVGETDGVSQVRIGPLDLDNVAGLVYRFTDVDNYAAIVVNRTPAGANEIEHIEITAGTPTTTGLGTQYEPSESRFLTIRVFDVAGTDKVYVWLDGVFVAQDDAYTGAGTEWGVYADWPGGANQRPPTFEEWWMWDKIHIWQGGEVWQGKVSSIIPSVDNSGRKIAHLKAEGPLANVAASTIKPPYTTGSTVYSGHSPGMMIGNILGRCGELHPVQNIAGGSFVCGPVGYPDAAGLTLARRFEEAEQGFLHETPQGGIKFDAAADRGAGASRATWSDDPAETLNYESLELLDWRREIINRVSAGVAVTLPTLTTASSPFNDTAVGVQNPIDVPMPNFATNGAVAGDLVVVVISSAVFTTGEAWLNPAGWRNMRSGLSNDAPGLMRIYAKVLAGSDVGTTVRFYNDTNLAGGSWSAWAFHFQSWRGAIADGLAIETNGLGDFPTGAAARAGTNDPPVLFVPWGREPCHFVVVRTGAMASTGSPVISTPADNISPDGYGNHNSTYTNAVSGSSYDTCAQWVNKVDSRGVEDPTPFLGSFTNFDHLDVATIAVRSKQGETVLVNDLDSQLEHNTLRTHTNPANVFPDSAEADDYADEILARYSDDSPILRIGYTANKSSAERLEAFFTILGSKITIEADNGAGMGINGDYIVESIRHRWDKGNTRWRVTYECSAYVEPPETLAVVGSPNWVNGTGNQTVTNPDPTGSGTMVAIAVSQGTTNSPTLTITPPPGVTTTSLVTDSSTLFRVNVWTYTNDGANKTFGASGGADNRCSCILIPLDGLVASTNVAAAVAASSTSVGFNSVTTQANDLVMALATRRDASDTGAPTGYTVIDTDAAQANAWRSGVWSTAASGGPSTTPPTITWSGSGPKRQYALRFRA